MVVEMDQETQAQVKTLFAPLDSDVKIHLFVKEHECLYCGDTRTLAEKVAELSDKVQVAEHHDEPGKGKAGEFGVQRVPAIVLEGKEPYKVRFYGIPAGHEFGALIAGIIAVSTAEIPLDGAIIEDIKDIDEPVHIQVFTTPQCPYCPDMVKLAHYAAILNPNIESDMVESLEFQDVAKKYEVFGVPKTIINENTAIEGLASPDLFVDKLYEAIG
ncbi:glutaredoxin [Candidatus Thorarchaeota archaeon]|nr:MAG: glutaredoxin [Candidatus Thorarchaeota archaeon]